MKMPWSGSICPNIRSGTQSRLVGAPPGYVGYEEGGQLTEAVRRKPYSVVLLDEIEKAHPEVFNVLLQVMEDGRLTEARGRTVDFRNTVLIMTSNVGAHLAQGEGRLGFRASDDDAGYDFEKMREGMIDAAKRLFRPEFINRVDEIIVFRPLTQADLQKIVRLEIAKVANRLQEHGLSLDVSDAALERLVAEGFDVTYGLAHYAGRSSA